MRRRLLWISEHASPLALLGGADGGGQNVYIDRIARRLAASGHEVDVFTRRDREDLPSIVPLCERARVVHVPAGPPAPMRKEDLLPHMDEFAEFTLRRLRRGRRGYDLVHANFFMSALVAARVKRALGTPFVVTFHALGRVRRLYQGSADGFPPERLAVEDRVVVEADRIIAECPQDEEDLRSLYGADPSRIATVPCGFDSSEFWPARPDRARAKLGLPQDVPIVLQLGPMVPRKGVDNAIRGLALARSTWGVAARLIVVGGESRSPSPALTPEIGRLQAVAHETGVADAVTFVGARGRSELRDYYNAADVFVSTPWYEPFGITPLEAMACGTPVIGSAVGGIKETVRDGVTGHLVPPNRPDLLAARLAALLRNPARRAAFGRNAIDRVNALFTWDRVANMLAEVYEEVLETPAALRVGGDAARPAAQSASALGLALTGR